MPFITITPEADRAARRARFAPAFTRRSVEAWQGRDREGWVAVRSSWIQAFRYDPRTKTLDVRVRRDGKVYTSWGHGVDSEMFRQLLKIRSAGAWLNRHFPPRRR